MNTTKFRSSERFYKQASDIGSLSDEEPDGIILLRNYLDHATQQQLIASSLLDWANPPNLSNLDAHFHLPAEGLFNAMRIDSCRLINRRLFDNDNPQVLDTLVINPPTDAIKKSAPVPIGLVLNRLRWLTLGYQYNWTEKLYFFDRSPAFPENLSAILNGIVKLIEPRTGYPFSSYRPEAGIVNFYKPGDSLTAHQDKSEINMSAPLISISLGLDAVFLIGTSSRNDQPTAYRLHSGDVLIMHGQKRNALHGVPKVIPHTCPPLLLQGMDHDLVDFIQTTRININVRQVNNY